MQRHANRHLTRHATRGVACAALLLVAACGSDDGATSAPSLPPADTGSDTVDPTTPPTDALDERLAGRTFLSSTIEGHTLVDGSQIRVAFENGTIGASAGCNQMGADAEYDGATLVVGELAQTAMACEPALMEQDQWLATLLTSRPTVTLDGDVLTIASADTTLTLLDRVVADPDLPLTSTTWLVDGVIDGDAASSVPANGAASITFDDGRAAVRTGCNSGSAPVEIIDGTIVFGPLTTTKMACEPALMELEAAVTRVLTGEITATIEAGRLTLTTVGADGSTVGLMLRAE